jgi:hypothetical protein
MKNPSSACCQAFGSFVFGLGVSACACAVPTVNIDICGDVIVEKERGRPICGEGWGLFPEKWELRSPHDTEPVGDVVDDVGRVEVAHRGAAFAGGAVPVAAAQHTARPSRGSCGICHASF